MTDLKTKLESLRTISHVLLVSLLKYEISNKEFHDRNGQLFKTSKNEAEALSQYLTRKNPAVLETIKKDRSIEKKTVSSPLRTVQSYDQKSL